MCTPGIIGVKAVYARLGVPDGGAFISLSIERQTSRIPFQEATKKYFNKFKFVKGVLSKTEK